MVDDTSVVRVRHLNLDGGRAACGGIILLAKTDYSARGIYCVARVAVVSVAFDVLGRKDGRPGF
jgi:hypothetical protein